MMLVRVVAPHFVAGLVLDDGTGLVVEAAPILRWALGWDRRMLRTRVARRGWQASILPVITVPEQELPRMRPI